MFAIKTSRGSAYRGWKWYKTFIHSCERSQCGHRYIVSRFISLNHWQCLFVSLWYIYYRLRLGLLNEEMKDSEIGISGDETFNDVVRDFSHLACSHPERLQRRNESNNASQPPEWGLRMCKVYLQNLKSMLQRKENKQSGTSKMSSFSSLQGNKID